MLPQTHFRGGWGCTETLVCAAPLLDIEQPGVKLGIVFEPAPDRLAVDELHDGI
jgi:hypothetical protein